MTNEKTPTGTASALSAGFDGPATAQAKSEVAQRATGLTTCAYCYRLCLSEEAFYKALTALGVARCNYPSFKRTPQSNATTHLLQQSVMKDVSHPVAIVCMPGWGVYEPIVIAGLLVHEAVHIWQAHSVYIGSFNDHGDEEEAYAIQWIAQQLMWSFTEQTQ